MILALLGAASAYTLVAEPTCNGVSVVDTVPDAGAVDVPVDVRVGIVFGEGGCANATGMEVTFTDAAGTPVPFTLGAGSDDPDATWLIELFPDEGLAADTAYVVTMTPRSTGETAELGFTTGGGRVAGLAGEPSFEVEEALWTRGSGTGGGGTLGVGLVIEPAEDPDGLSVLQVKDADVDRGVQSFRVTESGPFRVTARWDDSRRPAESCVQVRQIDGAGVATEWSDPQCEGVPLCGTVGGAPALALVLLGALGAGVRRRR